MAQKGGRRHVGVGRRALGQVAQEAARCAGAGHHLVAGEEGAAAAGAQHPGEELEGGRLAGAVGATQRHHLAAADGEGQPAHHLAAGEARLSASARTSTLAAAGRPARSATARVGGTWLPAAVLQPRGHDDIRRRGTPRRARRTGRPGLTGGRRRLAMGHAGMSLNGAGTSA